VFCVGHATKSFPFASKNRCHADRYGHETSSDRICHALRRHHRHGHLFQNRYKSILCQEDSYLLELVRYIHLNPLRAKLVADMRQLDKNPYGGHSVLMGNVTAEWQNTKYILGLFGGKMSVARRRYREFVQKRIAAGKRPDPTGGGLIRSVGGWSAVKTLRKAGALQKGDERILGDGEFVEEVLSEAKEAFEKNTA
jgi:putative transposase